MDALIDTPFNTFGDVAGAGGLISAGTLGIAADVVALVDDNEYSRIVLRGLLSKPTKRMAQGWSAIFTGALEGLRAEDLENYPESMDAYVGEHKIDSHIDTIGDGLGGVYVGIVDAICNPVLMLLRISGANQQADSLANWMGTRRDRYFGPVAGGGS